MRVISVILLCVGGGISPGLLYLRVTESQL